MATKINKIDSNLPNQNSFSSLPNNGLPQSPTNNLDISAATYLGGSEDDFTDAVDISLDGNFVIVGGSLKNAKLAGKETELLGGGDGTIVRYDSQTNQAITTTLLPGRVLDLEVSNNGDIAVAYEGGIAVLNPDATEVKWNKSLSDVSRIAISDNGKVGVVRDIRGGDRAYLFDSDGEQLQEWNTNSKRQLNDIAVTDRDGGMVIATGYEQKTSNLQVAFTQAWSYEGKNLWKNYDFDSQDIQKENLGADTRGKRVAIGRDGELYASYTVNGGTGASILYRDPNDLSEKLTDDRKIETDIYNTPTNVGSITMVWYGRYELTNGDLMKGQSLLGRLDDGKGNSVNVESIAATKDGTVILTGDAASKIANRDEQTIEGQAVSDYTPYDGYIAIISPDLTERLSWTPISDSNGGVTAAVRDGKLAAVTTTDFTENQITHNAIQDSAGGKKDGYLLVIGGNDAPPGKTPTSSNDNPPTVDKKEDENPQPIVEDERNNPDSVFPAGLINLTKIDLDGDNQADNNVAVKFSDTSSKAAYNNSIGYYAIANINGAVEDRLTGELINPEEQGYAKTALNQRVQDLELRRDTGNLTDEFTGGRMLVPFLIANGTVEEWMENNISNESKDLPIAYFSFLGANPDDKQHIRQLGSGLNFELNFEDKFGGGDNDFNDFVTQVDIKSAL